MKNNPWPDAIVIYANWHQGLQEKTFRYEQVQSRFLVWCTSGSGKLEVNGEVFAMSPGVMLFVPWNHKIAYLPNPDKPFQLGCIHIIPEMKGEPKYWGAYHDFKPDSEEYRMRRNTTLPGFENIVSRQLPQGHLLFKLGAYIIERYQKNGPVSILREFPKLLWVELEEILKPEKEYKYDFPLAMRNMLNVIESYLEANISLPMLAGAGGISYSGVYRCFKKYFGMPPNKIIMERRLYRAANLLLNTGFRVGEIARRLQFKDQFYFSKCFKQKFGMSPKKYRQSGLIIESDLDGYQRYDQYNFSHKHYFYLPERDLL